MLNADNLAAQLDARIEEHLAELRDATRHLGPAIEPLLTQASELLSGGKRLRAALAYWSFVAHGGHEKKRKAAVSLGVALELFQASALFHDDVLDNADTRRGRPAAHRAFAARHREAGYSGDAVHFGTSAAILLGDLTLVAAYRELNRALMYAGAVRDALYRNSVVYRYFNTMTTEVMCGQYLDVLAQDAPWGLDTEADLDRARTIIRAKSASYSVRYPLVLGAALAMAESAAIEAIDAVGLPLGEAFQLRDDILGVFGDPSVTGKPAGGDLSEGKRTFMATKAVANADPDTRAYIIDTLGRPDLTDQQRARLTDAFETTGARAATEALIDALFTDAMTRLDAATLTDHGRRTLAQLARAAVERHT